VHSSFKEVDRYDFKLTIEIEKRKHTLYIAKRPYVDDFLRGLSTKYELVVFTASLGVYANSVMDKLDKEGLVPYRLFREACTQYKGTFVKDMGKMGRDMKKIMILDNSNHSYAFNPNLGVPCESWFDDYADFELLTLMKIFESLASDEVQDLGPELEKIFGEPEDVLAELDNSVDD
jgi:RNA polymerase II subunit A small phosphatase-like protein